MLGIIAAALSALIGVMIWYLKHQTRAQTEREKEHDKQQAKREDKHDAIQKDLIDFSQELVKNELKLLHKDSATNARLNRKSIRLIRSLAEYFNKHFNDNDEKVSFRKKIKNQ